MKKTLLIVMACALMAAVFFPSPATAAIAGVDGYTGAWTLEDHYPLGQSGGSPDNITVGSGDEIRIPLTADMFTWSDGRVPINREAMIKQQLKSGVVRVRTKVRAGSEILDYVQFDTDEFKGANFVAAEGTGRTDKTAYISVKFAKRFFETEEVEFDYTIYLTIRGQTYEGLTIRLMGVMEYNLVKLSGEIDYATVDDGVVLEATENIASIRTDFGQGVMVHARMYEGERYTGYVEIVDGRSGLEGSTQELPVLYPEIVSVYRLHTMGYRPSDKVALDISQNEALGPDTDEPVVRVTEYHAYGEDMSYLGTTSELLPFSPVYFLSETRIDNLEGMQGATEYEIAPRGGISASNTVVEEEGAEDPVTELE